MATQNALQFVSQYALLQGRFVRSYLGAYVPKDRERFRDVADGCLVVGGVTVSHQRHGSGVLFTTSDGVCVNAHVGMADHPDGLDGGRLFEYADSIGLTRVVFDGKEYQATKSDLDHMVNAMTRRGLLTEVITIGRFPHRIFELTADAQTELDEMNEQS